MSDLTPNDRTTCWKANTFDYVRVRVQMSDLTPNDMDLTPNDMTPNDMTPNDTCSITNPHR